MIANVGFESPESVVFDPDADVYLVSNINGSPFAQDDNGFISRVRPDGHVLDLKWIDGERKNITLDAPRGMTLSADMLYVADLDIVRAFDRFTGEPLDEIPFEQASFINDVDAFGDSVYVTDTGVKHSDVRLLPTGSDAVYEIEASGEVRSVASGLELQQPSGLTADVDGLWVATHGANELFLLSDGEKERSHELPDGELGGVVLLPTGQFLVSSWQGRTVFQGPPFEPIVKDVDLPGDIGHDSMRHKLLIPLQRENAVWVFPLPDDA